MLFFEFAFWVLLLLVVYPFALYVPLLKLLVKGTKKAPLKCYDKDWPHVTFIISAYNEERIIGEKLDNTLTVEYPWEKLEIFVISDASDDSTDAIVRKKIELDNRIKLIRQEERKGKTAGINLALKEARGEIIVFSDANAIYQKDALVELVKYFKNPHVGYVVGAAVYNQEIKVAVNQCEGIYWDQELSLKQMESDFCSVVGGDGAIYAIRKKLFWPLREDDINDFANPLQIVASGYSGLFNSKAICYEDSAKDFTKEYQRKRRIVNRSFRVFIRYIKNFNLIRHRKFLFMLFSHKVLRWFGMFFIIGFALSALVLTLCGGGYIYTLGFFGVLISGLLAFIGRRFRLNASCPRLLYLLYYFYLVNIAAMLGIVDNCRGRHHVTWDHVRK